MLYCVSRSGLCRGVLTCTDLFLLRVKCNVCVTDSGYSPEFAASRLKELAELLIHFRVLCCTVLYVWRFTMLYWFCTETILQGFVPRGRRRGIKKGRWGVQHQRIDRFKLQRYPESRTVIPSSLLLAPTGAYQNYQNSPCIQTLSQPLNLSPVVTFPSCFSLQITAPGVTRAASLSLSLWACRVVQVIGFWRECPVYLQRLWRVWSSAGCCSVLRKLQGTEMNGDRWFIEICLWCPNGLLWVTG